MKRKVVSGLAWTYAERMLAQLISLIVTIILARLIEPEEYGAIAIVTIFISFADTFAVNGFGNALIQKNDADQLDFSSVFYFNIGFSILFYVIIFFCAVPIAHFYENEILTSVFRVMSIRIPIAAINSIQQAYVSKKMEFRKFFFATLGGTILSAVVGISMACRGFGVWALVGQYLVNICIDTIVLWFTVRWRPTLEFSWKRVRKLISYGSKVLGSSLLISIYGNLKNLIIGKKFSSEDLAYSTKGEQFPGLISVNINTSISKVLFPALSEEQDNKTIVKLMTRRAISVGTYLLSPALLGLAAVSHSFVKIIFTENWMPMVPFLIICCFIQLFQPVQSASIQAMKALGESNTYFRLELVKKTIHLCILAVTVFAFHSVLVIMLGMLLCEIISTVLNFPANKKLLNYGYRQQISDFIISIFPAFFMAMADFAFGQLIPYGIARLSIQIVLGILIFLAVSLVTHNPNYVYLLKSGTEIFGRKKPKGV